MPRRPLGILASPVSRTSRWSASRLTRELIVSRSAGSFSFRPRVEFTSMSMLNNVVPFYRSCPVDSHFEWTYVHPQRHTANVLRACWTGCPGGAGREDSASTALTCRSIFPPSLTPESREPESGGTTSRAIRYHWRSFYRQSDCDFKLWPFRPLSVPV